MYMIVSIPSTIEGKCYYLSTAIPEVVMLQNM